MTNRPAPPDITLPLMLSLISHHGRRLVAVTAVAAVVSFVATLFMPRMFRSDEHVGYEEQTSTVAEGLHRVGALSGFNLGDTPTNTDAIYPPHFQLLINSPDFLVRLMDIRVTDSDGRLLTYRDHITALHDASWWSRVQQRLQTDAEAEEALRDYARRHILCTANLMTHLVSISVLDRDALVAACMADSVRAHIQAFMTDYRRSKHEAEVATLQPLVAQAEADYERAAMAYGTLVDANTAAQRPSHMARRQRLLSEMYVRRQQLDFLRAHLRQAQAKAADRTAIFTPVQHAFVPAEPIGPRRGYIVGVSCLLVLAIGILVVMRRPLWSHLTA